MLRFHDAAVFIVRNVSNINFKWTLGHPFNGYCYLKRGRKSFCCFGLYFVQLSIHAALGVIASRVLLIFWCGTVKSL